MINLNIVIGQLRYFEAQIDSTLLNLLKNLEEIINFLHHITLPNFLRICQQNQVTRGKIAMILSWNYNPIKGNGKINYLSTAPYLIYSIQEYNSNSILDEISLDDGRLLNYHELYLIHCLNTMSSQEFKTQYGHPIIKEWLEKEYQYQKELDEKLQIRIIQENIVLELIFSEDKRSNNGKIKNYKQNQTYPKSEQKDKNKIINFVKDSRTQKLKFYNIYKILRIYQENKNKIIIYLPLSEFIRNILPYINIKNIIIYNHIIKNMFARPIGVYYHENFPSISKLWYEIEYYYRTKQLREKVKKEYENITKLEIECEMRIAIIENLNYKYALGKKEELRDYIKQIDGDLMTKFQSNEIQKYYHMANWINSK